MAGGAVGPGRHARQLPPGVARKDATKAPKDWNVAASAAYLRLVGHTQLQAAKAVGVALRTIAAWEISAWWPRAEAEAHRLWLKSGDKASKKTIFKSMDIHDDAATARWWAERRVGELATPRQRHQVELSIPPEALSRLTDEEAHEFHRLVAKLAADA